MARKTKKKKSPVRRSREAISATKARTDAALTAAAQTVASDPPADTNGEAPQPERIQGTPDQRQEAQQRAAECSRALDEVLQRFRCRIVPVLHPQLRMVGGSPAEPSSEGIVSCTYGVAPLV